MTLEAFLYHDHGNPLIGHFTGSVMYPHSLLLLLLLLLFTGEISPKRKEKLKKLKNFFLKEKKKCFFLGFQFPEVNFF